MDDQYVFEEIKQKYEKSNKYMLCLTDEDIEFIQSIEEDLLKDGGE